MAGEGRSTVATGSGRTRGNTANRYRRLSIIEEKVGKSIFEHMPSKRGNNIGP